MATESNVDMNTFVVEKLHTKDNDFVVSVAVPKMYPKPEIISWAGRYFVLGILKAESYYVEGTVWHIGSGQEINF